MDVCMYVCMDVCMNVCTYVRMHACKHACMCVCVYVCMYVHTYVRICAAWVHAWTVDEQMYGCLVAWMNRCISKWIYGWVDVRMHYAYAMQVWLRVCACLCECMSSLPACLSLNISFYCCCFLSTSLSNSPHLIYQSDPFHSIQFYLILPLSNLLILSI